ncbi:hypothetical protein LO80_08780 [Candidatus Francisella endociliophora]|uniref:Uncharacterized protein n=1 Tax=Candidatus Francisella endociliophora TaxID=653937 RepID=A0A097ER51_9GAMM|nr:hypothetical protein [Francisella sp. FSC1006]AIT10056.1 hypothetical protein LO80_08780 [Francisella sp. FSC1006]
MKLKKILLLTSVCTATLATTNLYAAGTTAPIHQLTSQEKYDVKNLIISNLDSLFPYQTQISVGKINQDSNGNIVASDILIMSGGTKNPNISINKLTLDGLKVNESVSDDFSINVEGLSVTNLASSVANSNVVSAKMDPKELANNKGFFAAVMNTLGQGLYNFQFKYDYSNSKLKFELDSTVNKKPFISEDFELTDTALSGTEVNGDFLANLERKALDSKIKEFEFDANFSEVLKEITTQYFGKGYKQTPDVDLKGNFGKQPGKFVLDLDAKLGSQSYLKYNISMAGIDLENASVKDVIYGSKNVLKNAYVEQNTADSKIELEFDKEDFPKDSPAQKILSALGKDKLHITATSDRDFTGSDYTTDLNILVYGLASFNVSSNAQVDGKLKLLPYLGVGAQQQTDLYDCKDQLCLTDINFKFANNGLLEKAARYTNQDPNTTPQQILGSYGALLQLFAVQQNDRFLQKTLSSLAMFLQNPKNIAVDVKAKKPVNETALLNMILDDAKTLQNHNPMKGGRVDLSKKPDIKLLDDLQRVFDINFDVNG